MKLPGKLAVHDGGRSELVHELQMSLFEGLLANDPALINHALSIDQRLAKRGDLQDISESGHLIDQIPPQT